MHKHVRPWPEIWSCKHIQNFFQWWLITSLLTHKSGATQILNTLRPKQNGRHFADDTFKCIFMNENVRISINISLKFVPKGLINNIPPLVQIMACTDQATSHYLNQWRLVYRRTYASLGLNELIPRSLTHWGQVAHTWISNLTIICSDNGSVPGRHQDIIWTNAGMLLVGP